MLAAAVPSVHLRGFLCPCSPYPSLLQAGQHLWLRGEGAAVGPGHPSSPGMPHVAPNRGEHYKCLPENCSAGRSCPSSAPLLAEHLLLAGAFVFAALSCTSTGVKSLRKNTHAHKSHVVFPSMSAALGYMHTCHTPMALEGRGHGCVCVQQLHEHTGTDTCAGC